MSGNDIKPSSRVVNQGEAFESDGGILRERPSENVARIFFQRVGRAFSDLGSMISRAFSNLADSFRGAFAHVSDMIRGVDSDTALRNVTAHRPVGWTHSIDLDEEESGDENFDANIGEVSEQSLVDDKNVKKTDFSENISPPSSRTSTEQTQSFEADREESVNDLPLIKNGDSKAEIETSAYERVAPQKTNGEILFHGFHNLDAEKKLVDSVSTGSVYMQEDCLAFAQKIVNNSNAIEFGGKTEFTKDMLKSANTLLKMKRQLDAIEEKRIKKEKLLEEQEIINQQKSSMEEGEWDFNEFLEKFIVHKNNETKLPLPDGGKYRTNPALVKYAEKIVDDKNSEDIKKEAATYLIRWNDRPAVASPEVRLIPMPLENGVSILTDRAVSPPPPPPSPSTPRWMSTLSSILGSMTDSRDEMPYACAAVLMPNHGMEDRNLAWQGLHLLLSPIGENISAMVASENEVALSYQHNSASVNEDSLRRFELARQLIVFLQGLNIDEALKGFQVTRLNDEQVKAIQRLKSNISVLSKELEERINVLSPARSTVVTLPSKIPALDSLIPRAVISASEDFNAFVKEFASLSEQQKLQYQFVGERAKYSRPNCAAIAQSVIASYKGLDPKYMIKEDQDRLSAAKFMISEFNKKNQST